MGYIKIIFVFFCYAMLMQSRVRFNNSWFVFHNSSWILHKTHFSNKHIFLNYIVWTEHKILVLKLANKYRIIQQYHNFENIFIDNFHHHPFLYWASFYTEPKMTNWKDETISHWNIYLTFDLVSWQKSIS